MLCVCLYLKFEVYFCTSNLAVSLFYSPNLVVVHKCATPGTSTIFAILTAFTI